MSDEKLNKLYLKALKVYAKESRTIGGGRIPAHLKVATKSHAWQEAKRKFKRAPDTHGYTPDYSPALVFFLGMLKGWKEVRISGAPWLHRAEIKTTPWTGPVGEVKVGRKRALELLAAAGLPARLPRPGYVMTIVETKSSSTGMRTSDPGVRLVNHAGSFTIERY